MGKPFDVLVFIGRFQPVHVGHVKIFEQGLAHADHLYVLVGSTAQPRNLRNPFLFEERARLVRGAVASDAPVAVLPMPDVVYNDQAWIGNVLVTVEQQLRADGLDPRSAKVGLIGHNKDASSYYLSLFPQWQSLGVQPLGSLNATALRDAFLRDGSIDRQHLPRCSQEFLEDFVGSQAHEALKAERAFVDASQNSWTKSPYPPIFVTTQAVVVQSDHVLLVRRGNFPGRGLSALPGGFLSAQESLIDGMLRKLKQETNIAVPDALLYSSIKASRVFGDPHRSARGRSIAHGYLIQLQPHSPRLPEVEGADGADKAYWLPLARLDPRRMHEDHYHIIQVLVAQAE